jgi:hypothetical protein
MEDLVLEKALRLYYENLLKQKDFYLKQHHCLESLWSNSFKNGREQEKERFFSALIQKALPGEKLKKKTLVSLAEILEDFWKAELRLEFPPVKLEEKEYEEKIKQTILKVKFFAKK